MQKTFRICALSILCFAAVPAAVWAQGGAVHPPVVYPIDSSRYLDARQFQYLAGPLQDAEVVGLSESIRLTHEFPLVRIGIAGFLNEHMGFHVLALEGSAVDLWATQDRLLGSKRTDRDVADAQQGLYAIWDTPEMKELFAYEAASWNSGTPLYITSYDIQPGSGSGTPGIEAFQLLADRLKLYADPPSGFDENAWLTQMDAISNDCKGYSEKNDPALVQGIASLQDWIAVAAPIVEKRYRDLPHAAVLRLMPQNLQSTRLLCRELSSESGTGAPYKATRDKTAAEYALKLKDALTNRKIMLWAHTSHLFYDSAGRNPSVGEILRGRLGTHVYSVAVFGEGGATILNGPRDLTAYLPVVGVVGSLRSRVNSLCAGDCFLDFRGTNDTAFTKPHTVFVEMYPQQMTLARDFDGAIWIKHVHAPDLPREQLLSLGTLAYRKPPCVYVLFALIVSCFGIAVLRVKRARQ